MQAGPCGAPRHLLRDAVRRQREARAHRRVAVVRLGRQQPLAGGHAEPQVELASGRRHEVMADAQRLDEPVRGHRRDQPPPRRLVAAARNVQRLDDLRAAEVEHQPRAARAQLAHDQRPLRLADDGVGAGEVLPHAAPVVAAEETTGTSRSTSPSDARRGQHDVGVRRQLAARSRPSGSRCPPSAARPCPGTARRPSQRPPLEAAGRSARAAARPRERAARPGARAARRAAPGDRPAG